MHKRRKQQKRNYLSVLYDQNKILVSFEFTAEKLISKCDTHHQQIIVLV